MILSLNELNTTLENKLNEINPDFILVICSEDSEKFALKRVPCLLNYNTFVVPNGEACKSLKTVEIVYSHLQLHKASRKSAIIAIGGGTVLDLAGFISATYMRGIPCLYIPTTLLSMVDSSEGGKTGINFNGQKNAVGAFYPALEIYTCPDFIQTLPENELLSGWAEVIKHAFLIGEDKLNQIKTFPRSENAWIELIQWNIDFKREIVKQDFYENSIRKLLNLGHTIGHALESLYLDSNSINHGICVANGIYRETQLAEELGICAKGLSRKIDAILFPLFPKLTLSQSDIPRMIELILGDKKNSHQCLNFSLLKDIGKAEYNVVIDVKQLENFLTTWAN